MQLSSRDMLCCRGLAPFAARPGRLGPARRSTLPHIPAPPTRRTAAQRPAPPCTPGGCRAGLHGGRGCQPPAALHEMPCNAQGHLHPFTCYAATGWCPLRMAGRPPGGSSPQAHAGGTEAVSWVMQCESRNTQQSCCALSLGGWVGGWGGWAGRGCMHHTHGVKACHISVMVRAHMCSHVPFSRPNLIAQGSAA